MRYLWIGLGGFLGAISRYYLGGLIAERWPGSFPVGTLAVNASGTFLLGLVVALGVERGLIPEALRVALAIGFIGAYTTFSTWSVETLRLLEAGSFRLALTNLVGSAVVGLASAWLGLKLGTIL